MTTYSLTGHAFNIRFDASTPEVACAFSQAQADLIGTTLRMEWNNQNNGEGVQHMTFTPTLPATVELR